MSGKKAGGWSGLGRWVWTGLVWALAGAASGQTNNTIAEYPSGRKVYTVSAFALLPTARQAWATANANMEWASGALEPTLDASSNIVYPRSPVTVGQKTYQLDACLYGYSFERIRPDYFLGDAVDAPVGVDWAATYAVFQAACAADSNLASRIFFDPTTPAIYFAAGGGHPLTWVYTDGSVATQAYEVATMSDSRPYRIFWTSYPYNAAPVDLSGKYVKLLGSRSLLQVHEGVVTNNSATEGQTVTTQIVSGVYLDTSQPQSLTLHAAGELKGQFLLAYYDSGLYNRLLDVIVVEVCAPVVKEQAVHMGDQLFPSGDGYDGEGLHVYQYNSDDPADGRGPYLYQHRGQYSYTEKNGGIFSIRPTTPSTLSLAEVYWAETDSQNVSWPFECDHYLSTWSPAAPLFVRGNLAANGGAPLYVPSTYAAELMKYQEPDHARIATTDSSVFTSTNTGYALLKLQADDNIWFQPIRSVMNTSFSRTTNGVSVGTEIRPPPAITNAITEEISAYLYKEGSSDNYNPNIYVEASADPDASRPTSALYFVNTNRTVKPVLEAWWVKRVQQEGMPEPLDIPSRPAWYSAVWPELHETPQIVLASQLGGLGESLLVDAESSETNAVANEVILADGSPLIYAQNDAAAIGYNPNEEHALIQSGGGGYVPWAIRCDLNTPASSRPAVLTQYVRDNQYKMGLHYVLLTNALYPTLGAEMTAGTVLPGPHPLDFLSNPWKTNTVWDDPGAGNPAFRDRKGVVWARCPGTIGIRMFYPMQSGFWFPGLGAASQPALDTVIPWLACATNPAADVLTGAPIRWTWTVEWPATVPEMKIGQTLTTASAGLPEVWGAKSVGVAYPDPADSEKTAMLYDPTVVQDAGFASGVEPIADFGFELGDNGNAMIRQGLYYFRDLPPSISGRFYYNPSADLDACLCLKGARVESAAGADILYVNVLNAAEREALKGIVASGSVHKATWNTAISSLAVNPVRPSPSAFSGLGELRIAYVPVDHYALTAMGGTNHVVLIENDATNKLTGVDEGDPISMHVFKVKPELYAGRVVTREDPNNLLSQQLDVLYTEMLGGKAGDFIFEWKKATPNANGTIPTDYENAYTGYGAPEAGRTRFTLGTQGSTLADLVNTYYAMRYQAKPGTVAYASVGTNWSAWCGPALAEGWVQRVLNSITPFAQRMQDLYEAPAETAVSMLEQIGGPYEGDVALNQDNLTSVGLIQLYQTVLNKAESLSLTLGVNNGDANKQLLLAAERLADLYMVLGNEAYVDALNPTVGIGNDFVYGSVDYGALSSSLYCFENQMDSLLDEELALLRGRSLANAPGHTTSPFFNRLLWNLTKGITAGEVAYAVNYGLAEKTGDAVIDENDAAIMYPQGHGDAWGHYLSALKGYYRLLRNPYFSWTAAMGEMNLADVPVNVDYNDESRFAQVAAAMAKSGAAIVDRTARKVWAEGGAGGSGYLDEDADRAFGYGDWGTRGGLCAFYNWAAANSLLSPAGAVTNGIGGDFDDDGLLDIHRGSVSELAALVVHHDAIQKQVDRLDRGLNPLGFSDNAIPFDISAVGVEDGTSSHFEQILDRAETALGNAQVILGRAQTLGNALRQLQDVEASCGDAMDNQEQSCNDELIAIFGYPYAGDIGPSGTYVQGYDGPDLYHYMWMDMTPYGFSNLDLAVAVTNTLYVAQDSPFDKAYGGSNVLNFVTTDGGTAAVLTYRISANGLVVKPAAITGTRRASGAIQKAYRDFLLAYVDVQNKQDAYGRTYDDMMDSLDLAGCVAASNDWQEVNARLAQIRKLTLNIYTFNLISTIGEGVADTMYYTGTALDGGVVAAVGKVPFTTVSVVMRMIQYAAQIVADSFELKKSLKELEWEVTDALSGYGDAVTELADAARAAIQAHAESTYALNNAWAALQEPLAQMDAVVAEGERILETREQTRTQAVGYLTQARYNDMFFRLAQNESLARYGTAFDLAQQYAWLAAKAYDYETGLLTADAAAGVDFLGDIIASRSLGALNGGEPMLGGDAGDPGLSDILARLKANWQVLEPRLGINNPQPYTTWFSLRQGLFRILPGEAGDNAWSLELSKHWVDDLLAVPEFKRYCQAFNPAQTKEPGLVIPFSTTIEAAKNLFGLDLAGGDSAYDSTYFATKIAAAGVQFVGYNALAADASTGPQLSQTPVVYMMPLGTDRMRDPANLGTVLDYPVVDQVMPVPFAIGSQSLDRSDWSSIYNSLVGATNGAITIRRYPSFRASISASDGDDIKEASKRLIGRSVWNTRWVMVIPAAALGSDRETALTTFIQGRDTDRDGDLDQLPVRDIQIGLRTYSTSGN